MSAASDNGNFTPGDTLCTGPANERRHRSLHNVVPHWPRPPTGGPYAHVDSPRLTPFITKHNTASPEVSRVSILYLFGSNNTGVKLLQASKINLNWDVLEDPMR